MAQTKRAQIAAAAGVPEPGADLIEGTAPASSETETKVREETAKGNTPELGEPASEAAESPVIAQREHEQAEVVLTEDPQPVQFTGVTVDAGGQVTALVTRGAYTVFDGTRLFTARTGQRIKTTRALVDRGKSLGLLIEE